MKLNNIEKALRKAIKKDIINKDLIDTGEMLRSIDVIAVADEDKLILDVIATDYFKYVSGNYDVMEDALNSKEFKDGLDDYVEDFVTNIIDR